MQKQAEVTSTVVTNLELFELFLGSFWESADGLRGGQLSVNLTELLQCVLQFVMERLGLHRTTPQHHSLSTRHYQHFRGCGQSME